jgi:hypothetical protein
VGAIEARIKIQSASLTAAINYPAPREWAKTAAPFLLKINSADNVMQLTVPVRIE